MASKGRGSTLAILFSIVVLDLIGFGIVLPILPFYAEEFGASATLLGLLLATHAAMQFVFSPIWGRLSDRIGRRPVMLVTIAGTSVALLVLGLAPGLAWLFVARLLSGVFGANISVATAYVADVTEEKDRTRWMGMVGASFGVGFLLGPAIGGLLAPYGHAVPMFLASAMAAANCVWAAFSLREPERHDPAATAAESPHLQEALAEPVVRRLCLQNFFFSFAVAQLESMFAYFMLQRFGYDARQVAFILVGMAFIMLVIQGGGIRHLAERYGERRLLLCGLACMSASFAAIPSMSTVAVLLVPLGLSATGRAITQPPMMSMVSVRAAAGSRGGVMGAYQASASLARVIGPATAGLLYDLSVGWPFYLASVLLLAAFSLGFALPARAAVEREVTALT